MEETLDSHCFFYQKHGIVHLCIFLVILYELPEDDCTKWRKHIVVVCRWNCCTEYKSGFMYTLLLTSIEMIIIDYVIVEHAFSFRYTVCQISNHLQYMKIYMKSYSCVVE